MNSFVENITNIFYFNWLIFSIAISYMIDTEGKETKDPRNSSRKPIN
jgi:preprotein translocase subunit SecG